MKKSFRITLLQAVMCYSCTLIWSERAQKVRQCLKFFLSFHVGPGTKLLPPMCIIDTSIHQLYHNQLFGYHWYSMHLLPAMNGQGDSDISGLKTCGRKNIVAITVFVPGAPRAALETKTCTSLSKPPSAAPNASNRENGNFITSTGPLRVRHRLHSLAHNIDSNIMCW